MFDSVEPFRVKGGIEGVSILSDVSVCSRRMGDLRPAEINLRQYQIVDPIAGPAGDRLEWFGWIPRSRSIVPRTRAGHPVSYKRRPMRVLRSTKPQHRLPTTDWKHTGIHGNVRGQTEYQTLIHVADIEDALAIIRRKEILPYPERESDNALYCKPIEVTWLSPICYKDSVFGSVAFYFNWSVLCRKYGKKIYGLHEVAGRGKEGNPLGRAGFFSRITICQPILENPTILKQTISLGKVAKGAISLNAIAIATSG